MNESIKKKIDAIIALNPKIGFKTYGDLLGISECPFCGRPLEIYRSSNLISFTTEQTTKIEKRNAIVTGIYSMGEPKNIKVTESWVCTCPEGHILICGDNLYKVIDNYCKKDRLLFKDIEIMDKPMIHPDEVNRLQNNKDFLDYSVNRFNVYGNIYEIRISGNNNLYMILDIGKMNNRFYGTGRYLKVLVPNIYQYRNTLLNTLLPGYSINCTIGHTDDQYTKRLISIHAISSKSIFPIFVCDACGKEEIPDLINIDDDGVCTCQCTSCGEIATATINRYAERGTSLFYYK